jgi:hypothetical protein
MMTDDTGTYLRTRRTKVIAAIAREKKDAEAAQRQWKRCRENIAHLEVRLEEIVDQMRELNVADEDENVIHMHQHKTAPGSKSDTRTRPSKRFEKPGPTTDIVAMAYDRNGIGVEELIERVMVLRKGILRATIMKLIRRMIKDKYAYRDETGFHLTPLCKSTWESSSLFRKAAANV